MFSRKIAAPGLKSTPLRLNPSLATIPILLWVLVLGKVSTVTACSTIFSYRQYDAILRSHVNSDGLVEYSMLKIDRAPLDSFLLCAEKLDSQTYSDWSSEEQIAFFINVYNAKVLQIIVDHYPIRPLRFSTFLYPLNSIMQLGNVFKRIHFTVMGRKITLHHIKSHIFEKELNEPAVHFALVRGTMSCPPLLNTPYTGELLYNQLQQQATTFLHKAHNFSINTRTKTVYLSAILKQINPAPPKSPTDKTASHLPHPHSKRTLYLSQSLTRHDRYFLRNRNYTVRFYPMNWKLNVWR